jgi:hypothetical protein
MNAIDFIKQHGIDKAREVVEGAPEKATVVSAETFGYFYKYQDSPVWCRVYRRKDGSESSCTRFSPIINPIELSDLKRLVESVELIKCFGDLEQAKSWLSDLEDNCPSVLKVDTCDNPFYKHELKQDIADYESIYSGKEH